MEEVKSSIYWTFFGVILLAIILITICYFLRKKLKIFGGRGQEPQSGNNSTQFNPQPY